MWIMPCDVQTKSSNAQVVCKCKWSTMVLECSMNRCRAHHSNAAVGNCSRGGNHSVEPFDDSWAASETVFERSVMTHQIGHENICSFGADSRISKLGSVICMEDQVNCRWPQWTRTPMKLDHWWERDRKSILSLCYVIDLGPRGHS